MKKLKKSRSKQLLGPPPLMSAEEFRRAIIKLGLRPKNPEKDENGEWPGFEKVEAAIGIGKRQCQRFLAGHSAVPDPVARLLQMYLKYGVPKHAQTDT